jgi:hypothetical protein
MEAHRAAAAEALGYMERNACWARRGKGGVQFFPGKGFLAAAYAHRSSRAGDPQLHTHVLVANATVGPDGRWSRLYHPAIYEHARTAGFIYEAHLRHELTQRLGVEWRPVLADLHRTAIGQLERASELPALTRCTVSAPRSVSRPRALFEGLSWTPARFTRGQLVIASPEEPEVWRS